MKNGKFAWLGVVWLLAGCASGGQQPVDGTPSILAIVFWATAGATAVGIGVFMPQLDRLLGMPTPEERFTVPKFKRTARLNGRIARAVLIIVGLGMLINGLGPLLLPHSVATIIAYGLLAFAFLGILLMIIITTSNWRT